MLESRWPYPFEYAWQEQKKITGLQPYSHRLQSCQIPSARENWIWWLVSNRIFQGQSVGFCWWWCFFCCCCLFCFKISLTTSAHLERKKKISPSFFLYWFTALFMVLAYPHLCYLSQIIQTFLFHFCWKYFNYIILLINN